MRQKRHFVDGAMYHITTRTNGKEKIFDHKPGKVIMMVVLREAKEKYGFKVSNFSIMPTHIHLLITPRQAEDLPKIMLWIKTSFSKRWNTFKKTSGHLWGNRYFSRIIKGNGDYVTVMSYIDKNPVKKGLVLYPEEWKESGAYHLKNEIQGFVDYTEIDRLFFLEFINRRLLLK